MRRIVFLAAALAASAAAAAAQRATPYWASISSGKAMMRAGPGRNYPGIWFYVRRDLPVRVVAIHESWRKIEDPGGTQGWMLVHLLSADRTGLVTGEAPQPIHEAADPRAPVRFRAEPGVVGRVSRCRSGWCRFEVGGRQGHIRAGHLWGLDRGEAVE